MSRFQKGLRSIRSVPLAQKAVALCLISVFISVWLTGILMVCTVAWAMAQTDIRRAMLADGGTPALYAFGGLLLVVPVLYGWEIGWLVNIGVITALLFFRFVRTQITMDGYNSLLDLCAYLSVIPFLWAVYEKWSEPWNRVSGVFYNPNYYGMMLEFLILICLYRLLYSSAGWLHRLRYLLLLGMNLAAAFLCDSQTAAVAVCVGVVALLLLSRRKGLIGCFGLLVLAAAVILLVHPEIIPRWSQMPARMGLRVDIWMESIEGIKTYPLFGQGGFSYYFRFLNEGGVFAYHSHNILLDTLQNFGIVGTLLFIMSGFPVIRAIWRNMRLPETRAAATLAVAAAAAVVVHGLTDVTILWPQTAALCFLLLAGGSRAQAGETK